MNNMIFKAVVGSQAYGTAMPTSDVDYKGLFMEEHDRLIGFGYREQIEINKDEMYFELRRFLQLASTANPTVLELLFSPSDCIIIKSIQYELIHTHRHKFLTTKCANSFAGYAIQQIKKARGLDKKMNWEKARIVRKDLLDFCYIYWDGITIPIKVLLEKNGIQQENCGLVKLNHIRDCYSVYHSTHPNLKYHGIIGENSNEVRLSSIPPGQSPLFMMYFNKDGYSQHCKDYREYQEWLNTRNTDRYVDTVSHGQKIDGKNLMHCKRLIEMAHEIAIEGTLTIRRTNASELLKIRRGEIPLEQLLNDCEEKVHALDNLFASSGLPINIDPSWLQELLLEIRSL